MKKLNKMVMSMIDNSTYKEEIYINNKHEYDYSVDQGSDGVIHTLSYSDSEEWGDDLKKRVAMQIIDDGNGIKIIGLCSKKNLSYVEAEQLHILLRLSSGNCVYQIAPPPAKRDF